MKNVQIPLAPNISYAKSFSSDPDYAETLITKHLQASVGVHKSIITGASLQYISTQGANVLNGYLEPVQSLFSVEQEFAGVSIILSAGFFWKKIRMFRCY
jgi:hypothetical protein